MAELHTGLFRRARTLGHFRRDTGDLLAAGTWIAHRSANSSFDYVVLVVEQRVGDIVGYPGYRTSDASPRSADDLTAQCNAIEKVDLSGLQDAPTQISEVRAVARDKDKPSYCEVNGYVTPHVGFAVRLPFSRWNGKFIELGCGGLCAYWTRAAARGGRS